MKHKLKSIVLIDDDEPTNYLNTLTIKRMGITENVIALQGASEGLTYLTTKINNEYPCPEILFLDVNMPGMDGWEFLEAYKDLSKAQKAKIMVVMLTTSLNPDDKEKASKIDEIDEFVNKPLIETKLEELLKLHFSDRL